MMTHSLEVVRFQVYAQLKAEAARGFLGILWWIIEPTLFMGVLYTVFTLGLRGGGPDFIPFLLSGLITWKWFASTVNQGGRSILTSSSLMNQVYLPKWTLPLATVLTNTVKFFLAMTVLLLLLLALGFPPAISWLALPLIMGVQLLLVVAAAGLVAAFVPFLPDLTLLVETGLMFMFFVSGIFFDIRAMSGTAGKLLMLNPMAVIIDNYRSVLLKGLFPNWGELAAVALFSGAAAWAAYRILQHFDREYPKVVP
jgi:lipopolysaccharide transport system permease protein